MDAKDNEELLEIANSSEGGELLEQSGCTAILSVSNLQCTFYVPSMVREIPSSILVVSVSYSSNTSV